MKKKPVDFDTVREIARTMPGVEEGVGWGAPMLKIGGKMFACIATNKAAEPGTLLLRVDFERCAEMLEADPETYYIRDHYADYPSVLVRLSKTTPEILRDLLAMSCRFVSQQKPNPRKKTPRKKIRS